MIRTKYLALVILGSIAIIFGVGIWSTLDTSSSPHSTVLAHEVIFATPREKYTVAGSSVDMQSEEREAFRVRVRETLPKQPVLERSKEDVPEQEESVTTPEIRDEPSDVVPMDTVVVIPPVLDVVIDIPASTTGTTMVASTAPSETLDVIVATTTAPEVDAL